MHEYSVMSSLVGSLLDEVRSRNLHGIRYVHIKVGELTFLNPDALGFAFDVLASGTVLEGAELVVAEVKASVRCGNCGYEGRVNYADDPAFHYNVPVISCPECGERPEIAGGKDITIIGVRVEEREDE